MKKTALFIILTLFANTLCTPDEIKQPMAPTSPVEPIVPGMSGTPGNTNGEIFPVIPERPFAPILPPNGTVQNNEPVIEIEKYDK